METGFEFEHPWVLLLIALLLVHIAAALKHHFIDKDDVLTRMLPAHADRSMDASSSEQST